MLDIGCRDGIELIKYLNNKNSSELIGIGLDLNPINEKINNLNFIQGHAFYLPFKTEKFQLITVTEVIEHLKEGKPLFRECHRILKKGGFVILTTPNKARFCFLIALYRIFFKDSETGHGLSYGHINEYTPNRLCNEVIQNGFQIISFEYGKLSPYIFPPNGLIKIELPFINKLYYTLDRITDNPNIKKFFKGEIIMVIQKI